MAQRHRELARARHGEQLGVGEAERRGLGVVGPRRVEPDRLAVPGRGVDDGLAVGREARRPHRALGEGEASEGRLVRRARAAPGAPAEHENQSERGKHQGGRKGDA